MNIKNGAAIITGSATGIGAAAARMLAAHGCRVAINYTKSADEAEATAQSCRALGAEAITVRADVSVDADCRALVEATVEAFGRLDVLVNSAGTTKFVPANDLDGLSAEDFQRIYAVNTIGPFQMARAAADHLRAAGTAAIVNVSSTAGIFGSGSSIAYATSKGALNTLTVALARVLAPEVRVNAVCPGFVQGRWHLPNLGDKDYDAHVAEWQERSALRMAATPEDVARVIMGFITGADLVTGQVLVCDAGANLGGRRRS
jgi:3-oxoacyl-[acyl-carrier protein] reductase